MNREITEQALRSALRALRARGGLVNLRLATVRPLRRGNPPSLPPPPGWLN